MTFFRALPRRHCKVESCETVEEIEYCGLWNDDVPYGCRREAEAVEEWDARVWPREGVDI